VIQARDVSFRHFSESFLSGRVSRSVIVPDVVRIIEFLRSVSLVCLRVVLL
jgi:hypothetical protein